MEVNSNNIVTSSIEQTPPVETNAIEQEMVAIRVPGSIAQRIRVRLAQSEFASVDEYASAVLDSILNELEKDTSVMATSADKALERGSENAGVDVFSKQDQEDIEDRLRGLGYM